ncbi:MAG: hypothetical protein WCX60_04090 [Anaerovoracaceae bacterium]
MTSQRTRYLLIGLLFVVISILAAMPIFQGNFEKRNLIYIVISAAVAILFLKNAFSRR